jgi:ATP-dependent DNA helicase RecG
LTEEGIQFIRGIGPAKARLLGSEAGIETVEDLLYYPPRRYVDRSAMKKLRDCFVNETVTVGGIIKSAGIAGRKRAYLEVVIDDGTDMLSGIFFNGINYFLKVFLPGEYVLFSGTVEFYNRKQITHPDYDFVETESHVQSINTGRVIPLYRSTEKLKQGGFDSRGFRKAVRFAIDNYLDRVTDPLDGAFLERHGLIPLRDAIFNIHFPETLDAAENARRRLSFNELFFMQYYINIARQSRRESGSFDRKTADRSLLDALTAGLPFTLTGDQENAIGEIGADIALPYPMNRLLQGDVGSGKTVVALAACMLATGRGEQAAVMSPTEILAMQHYRTFTHLAPDRVRIALLTGSTPAAEKKNIYEKAASGAVDILVGTHALIQDEVGFKRLGLIVIDEQHRFGVNQRAALRNKGEHADLLIMTATPIPRSLSLTLYGDLDVSSIREKPSGMRPVRTLAFPESRIRGVYNSVEKYIAEGRQVFFVFPLIEESQKSDLKSAVKAYNHMQKEIFPHRRVGLLHGRLDAAEKDAVMSSFKDGCIDLLVSTTVIEVGIDVPNASVMVVEHAERFGLSQLHQLRGRVGRGPHQSFCVLVYPDAISEESRKRIETLVSLDDGFKIAEEDLRLRGSGELLGVRQHGHSNGFEFADLSTDIDLIIAARDEAAHATSDITDVSAGLKDLYSGGTRSPLLKGLRTKRILAILS